VNASEAAAIGRQVQMHKYLSEEWSVAGYSVAGDVHHILLRSPKEMRALSFKTEDKQQNGQAEVVGFEETVFIL
jgi:hypothetical protein